MENWTSALSDSNNILSAILSHTPCGLSSLIQYHFFSYRDTSLAFARHSGSLSFVPQEMSLNCWKDYVHGWLNVDDFCASGLEPRSVTM